MSRGGFRGGRGGGRGGGGGGGGPLRDLIQPTADMNLAQWHEEMRKRPEHVGMLYPPLDVKSTSTLPAPTINEESLITYSHSLDAYLERGTDVPGQRVPTPWRRTGERKTIGIEIETFSGTQNQSDQSFHASSTILDPKALYLDEKNFPTGLWSAAFDQKDTGGDAAKRKKAERDKQRKKRRLEDGEGAEGISDDEAEVRSQAGSGTDDEGDFDFEDEEEDHQDYDANYFDNGEGDDDDDGAGEEDSGGGDTWD